MKYIYLFVILQLFYSGCLENMDLQLDLSNKNIVVEGLITNQPGPYYVRLTMSTGKLNSWNDYLYSGGASPYNRPDTSKMIFKPVTDAVVIISNGNLSDTLIAPPDSFVTKTIYEPFPGQIDTIVDVRYNLYSRFYGWYMTKKIKGTIGSIYNLKIVWKDKIYESSAIMLPVPIIDSVAFRYEGGMPGKEPFNIPYLYFKDPSNMKNYYLTIWGGNKGSGIVWPYSVFDDQFLKNKVDGLKVDDGSSADWWIQQYPQIGDSFNIELHSLTKEAYLFYKSLSGQFLNDGGTYSPSPATPYFNISNGGYGFFRASAVSAKKVKVQ